MKLLKDNFNELLIRDITNNDIPSYVDTFEKSASEVTKNNVFVKCCSAILEDNLEDDLMQKACHLGIEKDVKSFALKFASYISKELEYALDTGKEKILPIHTKELLKQSDAYFKENYMKFPEEWRYEIASNIVKKAENISELSNITQLYGSNEEYAIDSNKAVESIKERMALTKESNHQKQYAALGKLVAHGGLDKKQLIKAAHTLELLDRETHLYPYAERTGVMGYRNITLNDPISSLLTKKAAEKVKIKLVSKEYDLDKLASYPVELFKEALEADIVNSLITNEGIDRSKVARIIPTLPRGDKYVLERFIESRKL